MLLDNLNYFGKAVALSTDAYLTDKIDLVAAGMLGSGTPMCVYINVDVAADGTTTDETYEFQVHTDGDEAFGSPTTIASKTITYAALAINTTHVIDIPENVATEQYLGLYFNGGGTSPTVTVTAWVAPKGSLPSTFKGAKGWTA